MDGSKKPASVSVRLHVLSDDTIYTARVQSRAEVIGYKDPVKGTIVVWPKDKQEDDVSNPYTLFRKEAIKYAAKRVDDLLAEISQMSEEERGRRGYKPVARIQRELNDYLIDGVEFITDLQKQVSLMTSKPLPRINEYVVYEDDEIPANVAVTGRLPYKNPKNQKLTAEQKATVATVENFLDEFLDDYNKAVLGWYFGAALLNYDIYDDKISKMMIVASSHGGSGKSTLINSLIKALFTTEFSTLSPVFDEYFDTTNRFGTSALPTTRMNVYSEAEWARSRDKVHDFTGLNASIIKSMITEGIITDEEKFGSFEISRLKSFHTVITNYPPVIPQELEALNRRILPLMVKPTRMIDKARALDLVGRNAMEKFVTANAQAFANYFVSVFNDNPYRFTDIDYDYHDYVQDITDSDDALQDANESKRKTLRDISKNGLGELIDSIDAIKLKPFKDAVQSAIGGTSTSSFRVEDGILYVDSSKNLYLPYGNTGMTLRKALTDVYGQPKRKFHKRMFAVKL